MGGIAVSAVGFGIVFGLTARGAGFSLVEAVAFSTLVFAGASQFAAAGMVASGFGWGAIVLLTALVNARHLLYAAALAPWLRVRPRAERAAMAHVLTDESFALSLVHFQRLGVTDRRGYWIAAVGGVFIPWNVATIVGHVGGQVIPDPAVLGLDIVFPAAMAGLAVGLATGRREVVALAAGVASRPRGRARRGPPGRGRRRGRPRAAGRARRPPPRRAGPQPVDLPGRPGAWRRRERRRAGPVSVELVGLAVLMLAVTYPARAIPLLAPHFERLPPPVLAYLRLVGPAVLGAIAAVEVLVDDTRPGSRRSSSGPRPWPSSPAPAIVAWRRNLALGLVVAIALIALLRAAGLA